ncbi:ADP-heptose--LPS heptosyltransferase 2 [Pirellulimonas nuda]|uniref:lipopolysaccharide heptosyltransferase II n=1 Tax=Pirellulimonas nuda TaxID=2528009 RepID=A0A518D9F2_9BACT|nr:lipopolysaccharide heptosyltransferase II [Pirellulimonas nuda]QDU88114.1 ADP-heptose--LPS heptosyltransferase 2 [Pirellulimonas nuda]
MRIGVFLPNWIGDAVMATPALRSLRALAGPGGELVGVARLYLHDVYAGAPWFDSPLIADNPKQRSSGVVKRLRDARLDAVVLMPNSLRTAWLAWRSGVRERVGYARDLRTPLLTTVLREPTKRGKRSPLPTLDSYLLLAYAAGGDYQPPTLELATTPADERSADQAWQKLGLPAGERVVVFNTGGAFGSAKSWPAEHFAELARRIAGELGFSVVVNCGPAERDAARDIVARAGTNAVVSLADLDVPIGLSKAVIRRSRMLVTTDSGPRFFGVAFGKPVVTLFGPTNPEWTKTHYEQESTLSLSLACQPCWKRTCPLGHHRCMRDLSVDRVLAAVAGKLATPATRNAA